MLAIMRALRTRLTFANGMSSLALFVALGGSAYAAGVFPANSVGTEQLQPRSVTASRLASGSVDSRQLVPNAITGAKVADGGITGDDLAPRSVSGAALAGGAVDTPQIATGAVSLNRLSDGVQRRILQAPRGEPGPQGPPGPTGPAGPAGLSAGRFRYSAPADGAPAQTVIDFASFRMSASCSQTPDGTAVSIGVLPSEDVAISESVTVDHGSSLSSGGSTDFSGNLGISVPGGVETVLGGPAAQNGYVRAIASILVPFARHTVSANVVIVVDADSGRCSIDGTAVSAG